MCNSDPDLWSHSYWRLNSSLKHNSRVIFKQLPKWNSHQTSIQCQVEDVWAGCCWGLWEGMLGISTQTRPSPQWLWFNPPWLDPNHASSLVPRQSLWMALFGTQFHNLLQNDVVSPWFAPMAAALHSHGTYSLVQSELNHNSNPCNRSDACKSMDTCDRSDACHRKVS